jgi:hypothetical protein
MSGHPRHRQSAMRMGVEFEIADGRRERGQIRSQRG